MLIYKEYEVIIMEIKVIYEKTEKKKIIENSTTIKDLLDLMNISSQTVVVKRNNEVVIDEENIHDGDIIEIIRVIYGG